MSWNKSLSELTDIENLGEGDSQKANVLSSLNNVLHFKTKFFLKGV